MATFTQIGSAVTVGAGGAASISFSSIPNTYTDLVIKLCARTDYGAVVESIDVRFNGVSTGYSSKLLQGTGSAVNSYTTSTPYDTLVGQGDGATASVFGNAEIYIPNYAGSTYKSYSADSVTENNATAAYAMPAAWLWSNTAAISSIQMTCYHGANFKQYSTAYLYGVSNA